MATRWPARTCDQARRPPSGGADWVLGRSKEAEDLMSSGVLLWFVFFSLLLKIGDIFSGSGVDIVA